LGEVTGVAVNSKGHIFVLSRGNTTGPAYAAAAAQLLEFAPDGTFVREIGKNLYAWSFGHSVRVDKDDNVWAVDKGSDMVIKFNPEGRVMLVFGRKQEASDHETGPIERVKPPRPPEDGRFRQVTDVTWDPAGNGYISDGYINSRVAKVDKDGNWVKSFGEPGAKAGELNTPHSIAADAAGNIYVADRGNRRIQVFDENGKFLSQWNLGDGPTATYHIWMSADQHLWMSDGHGNFKFYKYDLNGKRLYSWGTMMPEAGGLWGTHQFGVDQNGNLYTAEVWGGRPQKFVPRAGADPALLVGQPVRGAWSN
jgi:DNA-binding beta-propeller fold protein YncE